MTVLEEEARTPEEAVGVGLQKLGLAREYVLVEILEEGAKGFLGLGGRQARVRLTVTPIGERLFQGRRTLEELLKRIGAEGEVRAHEIQGNLHFEIRGDDAGLLIGKHGETLESINFLVERVLGRKLGERVQLEIDIEGYRERRRNALTQRALKLAEQAKAEGKAVTLEPMSAIDRRTVHLTLQRDPGVRTSSQGEGPLRHLTITPVNPRA